MVLDLFMMAHSRVELLRARGLFPEKYQNSFLYTVKMSFWGRKNTGVSFKHSGATKNCQNAKEICLFLRSVN